MVRNTTEIRIDPLSPDLSNDDKHRLYLLFTANPQKVQFFAGSYFTITNNGQEERVRLDAEVIKRPSKKGEHVQRYQVLGEKFAAGTFGDVCPSGKHA